MTVMETTQPNLAFAELASDETIARTVAALGPSGITAEVVDNGAVGRARVLELLPLGAEVFTSLSETLAATGLAAEINESGRYDAIRPKLAKLDRATQRCEMKKLAAAPDFVVGSVAAITEDGEIMVASGTCVYPRTGKRADAVQLCTDHCGHYLWVRCLRCRPDLWTLLGITMIIAAGAYVVHSRDAHR